MTWAHLLDATIFIVGTLAGFAVAIWVEVHSTAYADDFNRGLRNWDHRDYAFDEHCRSAGVRDRRNMLPGRWSS